MPLPAASGVVDRSRLEQLSNDPLQSSLPTQQKQFYNSLKSTDEVAKNHSVIKEQSVLSHNSCEVWCTPCTLTLTGITGNSCCHSDGRI